MEFDKIYSLNNAFKRGALHVESNQKLDKKRIFKGQETVDQQLKFKYHSGSHPQDLIGTTNAWIKLISNKVVKVLNQHGFKGWSTIPALVYSKQQEQIDGYHVLRVHGRCGPIDDSKSREVVIPPKSPKGKPRKGLMGLYFDQESWDGSDIFSPEGTGFVFVTEKVKLALEEAEVSNLIFKAITEIENMTV